MSAPDPVFGHPFEPKLEAELCWSLSEAMKSVPFLKPRAAAQDFLDIRLHLTDTLNGVEEIRFVRMPEPTMAKITPLDLTPEDLEDVTLGAAFGGERLTPKGARLLVRIIRTGALPFSRKLAPENADVSALEAYGAREEELRAASQELRDERAARRAAKEAAWNALDSRARHLAAHPGEASPEELNRSLIDRVFIHTPGYGYGRGGVILLGGLSCHKDFDRYTSNSGKTRSVTPVVWWIDADGARQGDPEPNPVRNRRSDPDRNWGLGRD